MQEILDKTINKNFKLVNELQELLNIAEIVFICVPTPSSMDGSVDLSYVYEVGKDIGIQLQKTEKCPLIIVKSTVVPGATRKVKEIIMERSNKNVDEIEVAMVPEFLKQGTAYKDFINPDRIVLGVEKRGSNAEKLLLKMFEKIDCPKKVVDIETAEFSKYASNSFLAMKISFANELANVVDSFNLEKEGRAVNIDKIVEIMGLDKRINSSFLGAGPGYGGSCFPKDVRALSYFSRSYASPMKILETVTDVNTQQAKIVIEKAKQLLGSLEKKKIGIIGLAFKPNTDDTRDAPAKEIIKQLHHEKAEIYAWDPKAEENMQREFPMISYHDKLEDFEKDQLDAGIIITDWSEVKEYFTKKGNLPYPVIDTRRIGVESKYIIGNSTF